MPKHPTVPLFDDVMGVPVPTMQTGAEEQRDAYRGAPCTRRKARGCDGHMTRVEGITGHVYQCGRCGTTER